MLDFMIVLLIILFEQMQKLRSERLLKLAQGCSSQRGWWQMKVSQTQKDVFYHHVKDHSMNLAGTACWCAHFAMHTNAETLILDFIWS